MSSPVVMSFYFQPSSIAGCHGSAMYVVMIRFRRSYYKAQWMLGVVEEDRVNHGRIASRNEQVSRCLQKSMDSHHSRGICRSNPNDAWASQVLASNLVSRLENISKVATTLPWIDFSRVRKWRHLLLPVGSISQYYIGIFEKSDSTALLGQRCAGGIFWSLCLDVCRLSVCQPRLVFRYFG